MKPENGFRKQKTERSYIMFKEFLVEKQPKLHCTE